MFSDELNIDTYLFNVGLNNENGLKGPREAPQIQDKTIDGSV